MNAASAVIGTDLIGRFRRTQPTADQELRLLRWISLIVGCVVVVLSVGVSYVQGNLLELIYKVVNLLTAPLFSLFFLAIFIRRATSLGAMVGAFAGTVTTIVINYWRELITILNHLFDLNLHTTPVISFLWGTPLALAIAILVGMLVSFLPFGLTARQRERPPVQAKVPSPLTEGGQP
jgi:SSS family solute:Na+ symporter